MCCRIWKHRSRVVSWRIRQVMTGWGQCEVTSVWGFQTIPVHHIRQSKRPLPPRASARVPPCQSDVQQKAIDAESARDWRQSVGRKSAHMLKLILRTALKILYIHSTQGYFHHSQLEKKKKYIKCRQTVEKQGPMSCKVFFCIRIRQVCSLFFLVCKCIVQR